MKTGPGHDNCKDTYEVEVDIVVADKGVLLVPQQDYPCRIDLRLSQDTAVPKEALSILKMDESFFAFQNRRQER